MAEAWHVMESATNARARQLLAALNDALARLSVRVEGAVEAQVRGAPARRACAAHGRRSRGRVARPCACVSTLGPHSNPCPPFPSKANPLHSTPAQCPSLFKPTQPNPARRAPIPYTTPNYLALPQLDVQLEPVVLKMEAPSREAFHADLQALIDNGGGRARVAARRLGSRGARCTGCIARLARREL